MFMVVTLAVAKEIFDAFGPCSTVQECRTPEELVKDYEGYVTRNYERNAQNTLTPRNIASSYSSLAAAKENSIVAEWLDILLTVEEVFWEREGIFDGKIVKDAKKNLKAKGLL